MFHRQVLLNFAQDELESFSSAWCRYKNLLIKFPHHGLPKECQLEIFINGLCETSRTWVERGNGATSFYQQSVDEAYWMLEDMAEFDFWNLNCSRNNQGWENNSNVLEPWFDNQPQETGASPEFQVISAGFMEEMQQHIARLDVEVEDSFATLKRVEAMGKQIKKLATSITAMDVPVKCKQDCHLEDYTHHEEHLKMLDSDSLKFEDSSSEKETEDSIFEEESQEEVYEVQLIKSTPVVEDYIYEDPMWPTPPLPNLAPFLQAHQAHFPKPNCVDATCLNYKNHAKLEGNATKDPFVLLYDTYYGRMPLFDERFSKSANIGAKG